MKSKDQTLLEEAYKKITEAGNDVDSPFDFMPPKIKKTANEPTSLPPKQRDPETRDRITPTGRYAIEGPNPDRVGTLGYWDVRTGEFLYAKYTAPKYGVHKTTDLEAARSMAKELTTKHADLSKQYMSRNTAAGYPAEYNPFRVIEFLT